MKYGRNIAAAAGLVGLVFVVFWPCVHGGFFWDDSLLISDNALMKAPDGLYRIWFTTEPTDYFPLINSTWWLLWQAAGAQPVVFHLVNLALHAAAAILIWQALSQLRVPCPWLCAALFAIHPVNAESASWISEGKNTLSLALCAASLLAYLRFDKTKKWPSYLLMLLLFAAALLAKTSVVGFPIVLALIAWYRRGRISRDDLLALLPMLAISIALATVTTWFQAHRAIAGEIVRDDSLPSRFAVAGCAVWFYFAKAIAPIGQMLIYPRWQLDPHNPLAYAPALSVLGSLAFLFAMRRRLGRGPFAAAAIYLLMLLPILGFINIYFMRFSLVSDHWQYPAILAVIVPIVALAHQLMTRWNPRVNIAIAVVVLAIFSWISHAQATLYGDPESLWASAISANPSAWVAYDNYGAILFNHHDLAGAQAAFQHVVKLNPSHANAHVFLGNIAAHQSDLPEAIDEFQKAIALFGDPKTPQLTAQKAGALFDLGLAEDQSKEYPQAITAYRSAIALDPNQVWGRANLAGVLQRTGDIQGSLNELNALAIVSPADPRVLNQIGLLYAQQHQWPQAIAAFQQAIHIDFNYQPAWDNLRSAQAFSNEGK